MKYILVVRRVFAVLRMRRVQSENHMKTVKKKEEETLQQVLHLEELNIANVVFVMFYHKRLFYRITLFNLYLDIQIVSQTSKDL